MLISKLTGPKAGVAKYDLLTALAVKGLAAGGTVQTSMLRLIALITARYNWASDEVTIGQREMAALWSVDERTAKREIKRLIEAHLLEIKRAGVRGRVASYRLRRDVIMTQTAETWGQVGPDYETRMGAAAAPEPANVVKVDFGARPSLGADPQTPWDRAQARLAADHPGLHAAWFAKLQAASLGDQGVLEITAPSRFVADYLSSHHLMIIERAVRHGYGQALRCLITPARG